MKKQNIKSTRGTNVFLSLLMLFALCLTNPAWAVNWQTNVDTDFTALATAATSAYASDWRPFGADGSYYDRQSHYQIINGTGLWNSGLGPWQEFVRGQGEATVNERVVLQGVTLNDNNAEFSAVLHLRKMKTIEDEFGLE